MGWLRGLFLSPSQEGSTACINTEVWSRSAFPSIWFKFALSAYRCISKMYSCISKTAPAAPGGGPRQLGHFQGRPGHGSIQGLFPGPALGAATLVLRVDGEGDMCGALCAWPQGLQAVLGLFWIQPKHLARLNGQLYRSRKTFHRQEQFTCPFWKNMEWEPLLCPRKKCAQCFSREVCSAEICSLAACPWESAIYLFLALLGLISLLMWAGAVSLQNVETYHTPAYYPAECPHKCRWTDSSISLSSRRTVSSVAFPSETHGFSPIFHPFQKKEGTKHSLNPKTAVL